MKVIVTIMFPSLGNIPTCESPFNAKILSQGRNLKILVLDNFDRDSAQLSDCENNCAALTSSIFGWLAIALIHKLA